MRPAQGLRSSGFRSSPTTVPAKPRFADRKGQIEPIGRTPMSVRYTSIVWKNPQNDRSRKSRFYAPNLICTGNRHDKAHGRATRGKIARAANPCRIFLPGRLLSFKLGSTRKIQFFHTIRRLPPSGMRRVQVWRGGVRLSMSVSAPFVWRCLSGSAVAPFPHPAHRTDVQISRIRLSDKTSRRLSRATPSAASEHRRS